jgi:hypothetical protein
MRRLGRISERLEAKCKDDLTQSGGIERTLIQGESKPAWTQPFGHVFEHIWLAYPDENSARANFPGMRAMECELTRLTAGGGSQGLRRDRADADSLLA